MKNSNVVGRQIVICIAVYALFSFISVAGAADGNIQDAKLKIQEVTLFKNGLGYFTSTATMLTNARSVRLGQLPVPSFGTFWVAYEKDVKVRSLVSSLEELEENVPVKNMGQFLRANAGHKGVFHIGIGTEGKDVVEGVIVKTDKEIEVPEPPDPYFMDVRRPQDIYRQYYNQYVYGHIPGDVLLLETNKGITAMNTGFVQRADFEGTNIVSSTVIKQKRPTIRIELDQSADNKKVSVSYLAKGVTWAPGYLIDLSDANIAKFSAHALVVNELTDFNNVELELVTGFPNIKFGEIISPVAMSQKLADFLNALASGRTEAANRGRRNIMSQQAMISNVAAYDASEPACVPGYSSAAEGMVSEDLFLYPVKNFSLKKGENAWIPLFSAEMPYKHIYTWKVPDLLDKKDNRYQTEAERSEVKLAEEVWHSCRLINNLKMPLTTAAAEFIKDGKFTGQDVCYYTAPGAKTTIRINRAMNILAEQAEFEVERKRNAAQFYGYQYDLVKVQGKMKLHNKLDKTAAIEITKELSGEVLETSPKAADVQTAKELKQVNSRHELTWEIELMSGKEQELSYLYQVYIRN